jgi:hypothetical protein
VLRLWPDSISAGLFPGQCWLRSRRIKQEPSLNLGLSTDPQALLHALEVMLDDRAGVIRKGSRLTIVVSDSIGALVTLPWQKELRSPEELASYAKACFENQGIVMDESWVMRTEFRRYQAMGIAYALPQTWLMQLIELLKVRGLRLQRVIPISAAAYCAEQQPAKQNQRLVLLQESHRTTAFTYNKSGLVGIDIEPVVTSREVSGTRLLRRISARFNKITYVGLWSPELAEQRHAADYIQACLEKVTVQALDRGVWS